MGRKVNATISFLVFWNDINYDYIIKIIQERIPMKKN